MIPGRNHRGAASGGRKKGGEPHSFAFFPFLEAGGVCALDLIKDMESHDPESCAPLANLKSYFSSVQKYIVVEGTRGAGCIERIELRKRFGQKLLRGKGGWIPEEGAKAEAGISSPQDKVHGRRTAP